MRIGHRIARVDDIIWFGFPVKVETAKDYRWCACQERLQSRASGLVSKHPGFTDVSALVHPFGWDCETQLLSEWFA